MSEILVRKSLAYFTAIIIRSKNFFTLSKILLQCSYESEQTLPQKEHS